MIDSCRNVHCITWWQVKVAYNCPFAFCVLIYTKWYDALAKYFLTYLSYLIKWTLTVTTIPFSLRVTWIQNKCLLLTPKLMYVGKQWRNFNLTSQTQFRKVSLYIYVSLITYPNLKEITHACNVPCKHQSRYIHL